MKRCTFCNSETSIEGWISDQRRDFCSMACEAAFYEQPDKQPDNPFADTAARAAGAEAEPNLKEQTFTCIHCKKEFPTSEGLCSGDCDFDYCSFECVDAHIEELDRIGREMTSKCYHCGRTFPSKQAFGSGLREFDYCSRACAVLSVQRIEREHQAFLKRKAAQGQAATPNVAPQNDGGITSPTSEAATPNLCTVCQKVCGS